MTLIDRLGAALPRAPVTVELDEVQATVLRYRPEPYYGTHVMLHVADAQAGRAFVRRLGAPCRFGRRLVAGRPVLDLGRRQLRRAGGAGRAGGLAAELPRSVPGRDGDPNVGLQEDGATFTIPQEPVRRRIHGIETFNVLRGGEYFFLPSLSALRWLADDHEGESS